MQTGRYQKYIVASMMSESPKAYALDFLVVYIESKQEITFIYFFNIIYRGEWSIF